MGETDLVRWAHETVDAQLEKIATPKQRAVRSRFLVRAYANALRAMIGPEKAGEFLYALADEVATS